MATVLFQEDKSVPKMKTRKSRLRKDSGFCDEQSNDDFDQETNDIVAQHWDFITKDWSIKSQSIVSQEVDQLKQRTKCRQRDLQDSVNDEQRSSVKRKWQEDLASMMMTTQDLLQCLVNDFLEQSEKEEIENAKLIRNTKKSSKSLGRILEEKLATPEDKIYVVRTKNKVAKKKADESPKEIIMDGNVWKSHNSFTIQVDELEKKENSVGIERSGSWQWQRTEKAQSPKVWSDNESQVPMKAESEEIVGKRSKINKKEEEDINNIFWKITLEHHHERPRRMSEVLDNLSFQDHPDIFQDRSETLELDLDEGAFAPGKLMKKNKRFPKTRSGKPIKCYWNIFNEWRHNLEENGKKRRYLKRRVMFQEQKRQSRMKNRASPPPKRELATSKCLNIFGQQNKSWYHHPNKYVAVLSNNDSGIDEFCSNSSTKSGRRRSRDEYEGDDEDPMLSLQSKQKKLKQSPSAATWAAIQRESGKSFDNLTKNIEQKIREAFSQVSFEELQFAEDENDSEEDTTDEECEEIWPGMSKKANKILKKSQKEFINLRDEVRRMRKNHHKDYKKVDEVEFFHDWNWNLLDMTSLGYDDIFDAWKDSGEEGMEAIFSEWKHNLVEDSHARRRLSMNFILPIKTKSRTVQKQTSTELLKYTISGSKKVVPKVIPQSKLNQARHGCAQRYQRQLRRKCFPNQPQLRSIC